jgi:hypothetical protein
MKQTILTFLARVDPERIAGLSKLLDDMALDIEGNELIPFPKLKLLHFASFVLNDEAGYEPYLVFENNFDGSLDQYLEELWAQAGAGLHSIYSCCRHYPNAGKPSKTELLSYLRARVLYPNAFHIGNVGRSVERTHHENALRDGLEAFLDDVVRKGSTRPIRLIRERAQDFVRTQPSLGWTADAPPRQTPIEYVRPRLRIVFAVLIVLVLLPVVVPVFLIWLVMLRWTEIHEPPPADLDVNAKVKKLVEREDRTHIVQNHLCHISIVKPGLFRRVTLPFVLWLVNLIARLQDKGKLIGIPSIHFAHWSLIDNGRRLLFLSNFDGSWENYLDDFIDKVSFGLTAIWTNTVDFPKTRFLFFEGARDGQRFKTYTRDKQTYTNVWYSAYKQLTVETIDNNSSIREALFASLDESGTRRWLRRF